MLTLPLLKPIWTKPSNLPRSSKPTGTVGLPIDRKLHYQSPGLRSLVQLSTQNIKLPPGPPLSQTRHLIAINVFPIMYVLHFRHSGCPQDNTRKGKVDLGICLTQKAYCSCQRSTTTLQCQVQSSNGSAHSMQRDVDITQRLLTKATG